MDIRLIPNNAFIQYGFNGVDYSPVLNLPEMDYINQGDARCTGTLANLAASATGVVTFDLGIYFQYYKFVTITIFPSGLSSGFVAVQIFSSSSIGGNNPSVGDERLGYAIGSQSSVYVSALTANGQTSLNVKPYKRYLVVSAMNGDAVNVMNGQARVSCAMFKS